MTRHHGHPNKNDPSVEVPLPRAAAAAAATTTKHKNNKSKAPPKPMLVFLAVMMIMMTIAFATTGRRRFSPFRPVLKLPPAGRDGGAVVVVARDIDESATINSIGFPSDPAVVDQIFATRFSNQSKANENNNNDKDDKTQLSRWAEFSRALTLTRAEAVFGEAALVARHPRHFFALPKFDAANDTHRFMTDWYYNALPYTGGVALFDHNVYLAGMVPFVYDAAEHLLYYPASCKAEPGRFPSSAPAMPPENAHVVAAVARHQHHDDEEEDNNNNDGDDDAIQVIGGGTNETIVLIAEFWGDTYYHGLIEDLPRLAYVWDYIASKSSSSDDMVTILCPMGPLVAERRVEQFWNARLLLRHNAKNVRWHPYDSTGQTIYHLKGRLLIPTGTQCGHAQPLPVNMVRDRLLSSKSLLSLSSSSTPGVATNNDNDDDAAVNKPATKIMILVQQRSSRGLANHDEIVQALAAASFAQINNNDSNSSNHVFTCCEIVVQSDRQTMVEYAALHARAHIIVAPHGAGLANLIFTDPLYIRGVLELFSTQGNNPLTGHTMCHQRTAHALGIPHVAYQIATDGSRFGQTFRIAPAQVVDWVETVLAEEFRLVPAAAAAAGGAAR